VGDGSAKREAPPRHCCVKWSNPLPRSALIAVADARTMPSISPTGATMSAASSRPPTTLQLHDFALSGHCHRVRLMLSLLQLPYQSIGVDLARREQRQ